MRPFFVAINVPGRVSGFPWTWSILDGYHPLVRCWRIGAQTFVLHGQCSETYGKFVSWNVLNLGYLWVSLVKLTNYHTGHNRFQFGFGWRWTSVLYNFGNGIKFVFKEMNEWFPIQNQNSNIDPIDRGYWFPLNYIMDNSIIDKLFGTSTLFFS